MQRFAQQKPSGVAEQAIAPAVLLRRPTGCCAKGSSAGVIVVVVQPRCDWDANVTYVEEQGFVEQFVAHATVEVLM